MVAAALAPPELVALLLERGALMGLRSASSLRALDFARLAGREANVPLLR